MTILITGASGFIGSFIVEEALRQGHSELKAQRKGRTYQFLLSRISSGSEVIGLMILAMDITAVQNAEQNRREFTANVSHELKTPLQSIIGSAELLENGLGHSRGRDPDIGHEPDSPEHPGADK